MTACTHPELQDVEHMAMLCAAGRLWVLIRHWCALQPRLSSLTHAVCV